MVCRLTAPISALGYDSSTSPHAFTCPRRPAVFSTTSPYSTCCRWPKATRWTASPTNFSLLPAASPEAAWRHWSTRESHNYTTTFSRPSISHFNLTGFVYDRPIPVHRHPLSSTNSLLNISSLPLPLISLLSLLIPPSPLNLQFSLDKIGGVKFAYYRVLSMNSGNIEFINPRRLGWLRCVFDNVRVSALVSLCHCSRRRTRLWVRSEVLPWGVTFISLSFFMVTSHKRRSYNWYGL